MSPSLLQNHDPGVWDADLGVGADLQPPGRSIVRRSSHLGTLDGPRSNRHHCGMDSRRRHCSTHCYTVSPMMAKTASRLCLTIHRSSPRLHVVGDRSRTGHGSLVGHRGSRHPEDVGRSHHHSRPGEDGQTYWVEILGAESQ
jgi:hypothetical protein